MTLDANTLVLFVAFWALLLLTLARRTSRETLRQKAWGDWVLDVTGLLVQGVAIPALQIAVVWAALSAFRPTGRGVWSIPGWQALILNVVVIDYLYYWNHRLLHARALWPLHRVHHTLTAQDVLGTSRNTLYSSLFIVYLWANGVFLYLLTDPTWFVAGVTLTAAFDLWRHSTLGPAHGSPAHRLLSLVIVTPADHGWHHSADRFGVNFGANLSLWDRLHGTWLSPDEVAEPPRLGVDDGLPLWRRLLWPFVRGDLAREPHSQDGKAVTT
jgi:sterol desaturase/sphingolipid hydroxylase (fatty acid hydroxylase superfamily)